MIPTAEQERIFLFIKKRPENVLIKAYAGAGKTSTVVEAVKLLPEDANIMFLAFNKHIQEELKTKLPEHVRCYTTYGLGMSAIKRKYGDKIQFDEFKADKIILKKSKSWGLHDEFKTEEKISYYLNSIKKLCNLCRLTLTVKPEFIPYVADRYEITNLRKPEDIKRVLKILDEMSINRETFDFTDMVYLPAIDNGIWMFPQDYVFVDECIPGNTYVSTINGKFKIKTLCAKYDNGDKLSNITTFNEGTNKFETKKINKIWCNGIKDVYCVRLGTKRRLYSTINHQFLTLNGWKRLDELKIGDAILTNHNKQPYHAILNNTQKEIVIGSILGDGCFQNLSKNIYRIHINHGEKQKKYIQWKATLFNCRVKRTDKNGYSQKPSYGFTTPSYYYDYSNIENIIKLITPQSLAIAWMDDGSLSRNELSSTLFSLATNKENVELLSNIIFNKWNIKSNVRTSKSSSTHREYYYLGFNKENTEKISELLSPYIHKSMKYKILSKHWNNINNNNWIKHNDSNLGCIVVTDEYKFYKSEKVYDINVEGNHNFIITSCSMGTNRSVAGAYGIISHNCQDMNRCQLKIIEKVLKRDRKTGKVLGRLISVGDFFQGVYGFNASDEKSFEWFENFPNTRTLPLSYSFRCAKNIIIEAQKIVPDIKALPDAPDGIVRDGDVLTEAQSGDFILCRTTMPLVKLFFQFLIQNKKAIIKGSDIGVHLIELIGKIDNIKSLIDFWEGELLSFSIELKRSGVLNPYEHSGYVALDDKVSTLVFLAKLSDSIEDLKIKIRTIFTDEIQGIVLSTVHKIKGLEANRVFIIRPDLLPLKAVKGWQQIQEKNLEYVAITRAKTELIYDRTWTNE